MSPTRPGPSPGRRSGPAAASAAEAFPPLHEAPDLAHFTISARYGRRDYLVRRALAVADLIAAAAALTLAIAASPARDGLAHLLPLLAPLPVLVLLFRAYGLYERDVKRINHAVLDDVPNLCHAILVATLLMWVYSRITLGAERLSFAELAIFAIGSVALVCVIRAIARRVVTRALGPERIVFLGEPSNLPALVRKIATHPEYGLEPVGFVPLREPAVVGQPIPFLGRLGDLDMGELVRRHAVERVIVSHAEVEDEALLELLRECGSLSVKVSVLPRYVDALGPSVEVDDIEGVTVLDLNPLVLPRSSRMLKRTLDFLGAGVALVLLAPLMGLIAIAIRFDSDGPILFRQGRIGRRGRRFELLKFRTMVPDAEEQVGALLDGSRDPHWLHLDHDPRVTRVGRVLRLMSLDEVPQLWNVAKGEMSLVGPRPLIPAEDARVTGWARTRLDLAPGITGLWQVLGRTNIPFKEMVTLDTLYVTNWSLWLDAKLILRTFRIVLTRQGAN